MSAYSVTREGQELGSFELSQIQEGLQTGFFQPGDWGWREGMSGWQGLPEIAGPVAKPQAKTISSPASTPVRKLPALKPDNVNPYVPPASNVVITRTSGEVPHDVVEELKATRPWVRTIAIIMGIGCALMTLGSVVLGGLGVIGLMSKSRGSLGAPEMMILFVIYGIFAALTFYPARKLSKYAANIASLAESNSFSDLTEALVEQRRAWKFFATLMIIYVAIMLVIFVGSILVGLVR